MPPQELTQIAVHFHDNAGVDILAAQRFMGHSDPAVTMAIYSHLAKEKEDESADLVRNAISGKVSKSCQNQSE